MRTAWLMMAELERDSYERYPLGEWLFVYYYAVSSTSIKTQDKKNTSQYKVNDPN